MRLGIIALLLFSLHSPGWSGETTRNDAACTAARVIWQSYQSTVDDLLLRLLSKDFVKFEEASECLVSSSKRFDNGKAGASAVYLALRRQMAPAQALSYNRQLITIWRLVRPKSPFADFADARLSYASAWNVRGGGTASTTSDNSFREFQRLLRESEDKLLSASPELRDTPLWHNLMLATALDISNPKQDPEAVFKAAVRRWPVYWEFYEVRLSRLTPRWGGDWNRVDGFVGEWTAALDESEGESTYARLYASLMDGHTPPSQTKLNWNRMKASLDDLWARYPAQEYQQLTATFACEYGDVGYLRKVLKRDAGPVEMLPWLDERAHERCLTLMRKEFPKQLPPEPDGQQIE